MTNKISFFGYISSKPSRLHQKRGICIPSNIAVEMNTGNKLALPENNRERPLKGCSPMRYIKIRDTLKVLIINFRGMNSR